MIMPEHIKTRAQLGLFGEDYVRATLRRAGFDVFACRKGEGGDLIACGLRIEVKISNQSKKGHYQFCLKKEGCTDCTKSDIVILLAVSTGGLITSFVLPSIVFSGKQKCELPKLYGYRGKYAEYRKPILDGLRRFTAIRQ